MVTNMNVIIAIKGGRVMKGKGLVLVMLFLLLPSIVFAGGGNPWEKKLPFKKATITYSLGGMQEGTETLYIRDYGKETAAYTETTTKMMGMVMKTQEIEIVTPDFIYSFDLTEQSGVKSVNPQKYMIDEYNKLSKAEKKQVNKNAETTGVSMTEGLGGEIEKNATKILGYKCDKMTVMGSTIYMIHDTQIPLKTEVNMMGMKMQIVATDIKEGKVDASKFEHPEGIELVTDQQADAAARTMAKQTMDMLKDPEGAKPGALPSQQQQQLSPEEQKEMEQAMQALKGILGGGTQ